jgi:hypothetical protein
MQKAAYLLIFLVVWGQFDDVLLVPFLCAQSTPLAGDDDEYVPVQREQGRAWAPGRQKSVLECLKPKTADLCSIPTRRDFPPGSKSAGPIDPSPLYLLMSLQL